MNYFMLFVVKISQNDFFSSRISCDKFNSITVQFIVV